MCGGTYSNNHRYMVIRPTTRDIQHAADMTSYSEHIDTTSMDCRGEPCKLIIAGDHQATSIVKVDPIPWPWILQHIHPLVAGFDASSTVNGIFWWFLATDTFVGIMARVKPVDYEYFLLIVALESHNLWAQKTRLQSGQNTSKTGPMLQMCGGVACA